MPIVELRGVGFRYAEGPEVLSSVNLSVDRGEFVAIAGPNGGGKTTLVRLIVGLERPTSGNIELFNGSSEKVPPKPRVGYLSQRSEVGIAAPITVEELVAAGRSAATGAWQRWRPADRSAVLTSIELVGLDMQRGQPLRSLSGGQRQRALIAKALAGEPDLLVLDEPTVGVDNEAQDALAQLIDRLRQDLNITVLYVSHEFGAIERFVTRLVLVRKKILFDGKPNKLGSDWHDPSHVHV